MTNSEAENLATLVAAALREADRTGSTLVAALLAHCADLLNRTTLDDQRKS